MKPQNIKFAQLSEQSFSRASLLNLAQASCFSSLAEVFSSAKTSELMARGSAGSESEDPREV